MDLRLRSHHGQPLPYERRVVLPRTLPVAVGQAPGPGGLGPFEAKPPSYQQPELLHMPEEHLADPRDQRIWNQPCCSFRTRMRRRGATCHRQKRLGPTPLSIGRPFRREVSCAFGLSKARMNSRLAWSTWRSRRTTDRVRASAYPEIPCAGFDRQERLRGDRVLDAFRDMELPAGAGIRRHRRGKVRGTADSCTPATALRPSRTRTGRRAWPSRRRLW